MTDKKLKPYIIIVLISIVLISILSIGIITIIALPMQSISTYSSVTSDFFTNFGNQIETDIHEILQEDSAKSEMAQSYLYELISLNDRYNAMIKYNTTNPFNYTQQDFDDVKIEFASKIRSLDFIVDGTSVYFYSNNKLGANAANNYTYLGEEFYFIYNQWFGIDEFYIDFHADIRDYVNISFTSSGTPLDIQEIRLDRWTYHLYNNLSILDSISHISEGNKAVLENIGISLVNLSLAQLGAYSLDFSGIKVRLDTINQYLSSILVTLALSGVLMGFAIAFDNLNFRRISLIVGLLIFLIAILYFSVALQVLLNLPSSAEIVGENVFNFKYS